MEAQNLAWRRVRARRFQLPAAMATREAHPLPRSEPVLRDAVFSRASMAGSLHPREPGPLAAECPVTLLLLSPPQARRRDLVRRRASLTRRNRVRASTSVVK